MNLHRKNRIIYRLVREAFRCEEEIMFLICAIQRIVIFSFTERLSLTTEFFLTRVYKYAKCEDISGKRIG